jgi:hypothetical protein
MTVKSLRKQLAAAIAMTLVATVALGSSTYAWFAINGKVTATTTSFETRVSNNLFIAEDTLGSTAKIDDAYFKTALVKDDITGILEPVSTIDGINFFYSDVTNVLGNGDTKTDEWNAYDETAFQTNYEQPQAVGYIDYVYQLKAVNGSKTANADIKLTSLDMFFNKAADTQTAYRVAVFVQDITTADDDIPAMATTDLKAIYTVSGATNFTVDGSDQKAVEDEESLGTVTYNAPITLVANKIGGANGATYLDGTTYYKVLIRVWLEGEDTTCNNTTFANLQDGKWSLSTAWTLGSGTAVANIAEIVGAIVDLTETDAYKLSDDANDIIVINNVTYTKIVKDNAAADPTVNGNAIYANNTTIATSNIFTIDSDKLYPIDVTNMVKVN